MLKGFNAFTITCGGIYSPEVHHFSLCSKFSASMNFPIRQFSSALTANVEILLRPYYPSLRCCVPGVHLTSSSPLHIESPVEKKMRLLLQKKQNHNWLHLIRRFSILIKSIACPTFVVFLHITLCALLDLV